MSFHSNILEDIDYLCITLNSSYMENILAYNLKFLRKYHKLNLTDLAVKLGVSKSSISDYENGKFVPTFSVIDKYCEEFDIDISKLNSAILDDKNINESEEKNSELLQLLHSRYELLLQKLEGVSIQNKLLQQLLDSKDSELKTLKIQVNLLLATSKII